MSGKSEFYQWIKDQLNNRLKPFEITEDYAYWPWLNITNLFDEGMVCCIRNECEDLWCRRGDIPHRGINEPCLHSSEDYDLFLICSDCYSIRLIQFVWRKSLKYKKIRKQLNEYLLPDLSNIVMKYLKCPSTVHYPTID